MNKKEKFMSLLKKASLTTSRRQGKNLITSLPFTFFRFLLLSGRIATNYPSFFPRFPQQWINALFYYLVAILEKCENT
jgi:hypothetical protein